MSLARKMNQVITYWAPLGQNDYGEQTFAAPVALSGRWEANVGTIRTPSGEETAAKATIWTLEPLALEGYVALDDLTVVDNPSLVAEASEIRDVISTPSMRTNELERRALV
jgi:hypothetical protein